MEIEVLDLPVRKAACVSHKGPYMEIGSAFHRIYAWVEATHAQINLGVGLYYDDPTVTPAEELRSEAGVLIEGDLPGDDPSVHVVEVPGGTVAVAHYVGPYEGLPEAWQSLMGGWMATCGYVPRSDPPYEIYVDDVNSVEPAKLRTDICVPVQPI